MKNIVRELRQALGLNQADFARLIGKSYASVQQWEAGKRIPRDMIKRLDSIASKHGVDLRAPGPDEAPQAEVADPSVSATRDECIQMLVAILDSGHSQAIRAVTENLVAFHRLILVDRPDPRKRAAEEKQ